MKLFMSREDLITELNDLAEEARLHIPAINHGGCCVFAVAVVKMLNKFIAPERIRLKLREYEAADNEAIPIEEIRSRFDDNTMDNWSSNGVTFNHVFLEIDIGGEVMHFDSTGLRRLRYTDREGKLTHSTITVDYVIRAGVLSLEDAEQLAAEPDWNHRFDRDLIPHLQEVVDAAEGYIRCDYRW